MGAIFAVGDIKISCMSILFTVKSDLNSQANQCKTLTHFYQCQAILALLGNQLGHIINSTPISIRFKSVDV